MGFKEAEMQYAEYITRFNARQISGEDLIRLVQELRIQDADGAWWQMHGTDGAWLTYRQNEWVSAIPPSSEPSGMDVQPFDQPPEQIFEQPPEQTLNQPPEQPTEQPSEQPQTEQPTGRPPQQFEQQSPQIQAGQPVKVYAAVPFQKPAAPLVQKSAVEQPQTGAPKNLIHLFFLLLLGVLKGIPKHALKVAIKAGVSFAVVLIVHTYMVVVKNEGFSPNPSSPIYKLMNLQGTEKTAVAFWGIATFLATSIFARIRHGGPKKFINDMLETPSWAKNSFKLSGKASWPAIIVTVLLAMLSSLLIKNNYIVITLAIGILLSVTTKTKSIWFLAISTGWSDLRRLFKTRAEINPGLITLMILGLGLGFLAAYILPYPPYSTYVLVVAAIAGGILIKTKKVTPKAMMWVIGFAAVQLLFFKTLSVFADDGGWNESGGNFWSWIRSPGAAEAFRRGFNPAMAAFLASLAAGSGATPPPPIPGVMDYNKSGWHWIQKDGKWVLGQTGPDGKNIAGTGLPQSIFDTDPSLAGDNINIYTQPTPDFTKHMDNLEKYTASLDDRFTKNLTPEGWRGLDDRQKMIMLNNMAREIATSTGVKPGSFRLILDPNETSTACWHGGSRTITISPTSKEFDSPYGALLTIAHEIRHGAQEDHANPLEGGEEYRRLATFNDKNYQGAGTDFTRYSGQLLERDSENFGRAVGRAIFVRAMGVNLR